jgi:hypothetical protein
MEKSERTENEDGKEKKGSDGKRARWCEQGTDRSARGEDG